MEKFVTLIQAIDPKDGNLKTFYGDYIEAKDENEAQNILDETGRGYMKVSGGFVEEIDTDIDKLFKSFKLDLDAKK